MKCLEKNPNFGNYPPPQLRSGEYPISPWPLLYSPGSFAYVDVSDKGANTKAMLTSAPLMTSYSGCHVNFSYYLHGEDPGTLRVMLQRTDEGQDPTVLYDVKGNE